MNDRRLIEAGFPCHQVGGETRRERDSGLAPPTHRLHVWWARRPLTASRAAIAGSLMPENTDMSIFIRALGIEKKVAEISNGQWVITGKLAKKIVKMQGNLESIIVDTVIIRAFNKEQLRRETNRKIISQLKSSSVELSNHPVLQRWELESHELCKIHEGEVLTIKRVMGDPAHTNERLEFKKNKDVKKILGKELSWDTEDLYGYERAFQNDHIPFSSNLTVLDPTSGGGSIPFEALRLGHKVIANELNPVAAIILYSTLDFPVKFGDELSPHIYTYGKMLVDNVHFKLVSLFPSGKLDQNEKKKLDQHLSEHSNLVCDFDYEEIVDYLYCRQVICPSCLNKSPLLNSQWLAKPKPSEGTRWAAISLFKAMETMHLSHLK